ncbi:hypothetical protein [Neobacillus terrae]|uniref:hypothetical protein n=1 Tax=Neobacillus terrae TaxID=3034837 RepID=UPI00140E0215|nr:hypothetical protein [Neobacillus terrae]NHM30488.1 hypothetical protein [Neobacillus terrae]
MTLVIVFGLALSGMALTANKQFHKTDNLNRATDLAEMGATYYKSVINSLIPSAVAAARTNKTTFCQELKRLHDRQVGIYDSKTVESSNKYQISSPVFPACIGNPNNILLNFISTGKTGTEEKAIIGHLKISKRIASVRPDYSAFEKYEDDKLNKDLSLTDPVNFTNDNFKITGGSSLRIEKSAYFKSLTLDGNAEVLIGGNAVFQQITSMNGNTLLIVEGDAYFQATPIIEKFVGHPTLCIKGNIYKVDNNQIMEYTDFSNYFTNTCVNSNADWYIDAENGLSVDY